MSLGLPDGHGIGRSCGLKSYSEENDLTIGIGRCEVHGIERGIDDPHVAPLRLELQQVAVRPGTRSMSPKEQKMTLGREAIE